MRETCDGECARAGVGEERSVLFVREGRVDGPGLGFKV